ncbi:MAG: hypothetical protein H6Q13_721 [Bacteroidetes bacterium]|jgi:hypothetical protein|nr:hypothetical protein [Bacteroidota bacterium]
MKKLFSSILLFSFLLFSVAFAKEEPKLESPKDLQSPITLNVTGKTLHVENVIPGSLMEIYDVVGIKLVSIRLDSADKTIGLNLSKGYYILKVSNVVRKIVIK